jgi:hypothetical protein
MPAVGSRVDECDELRDTRIPDALEQHALPRGERVAEHYGEPQWLGHAALASSHA